MQLQGVDAIVQLAQLMVSASVACFAILAQLMESPVRGLSVAFWSAAFAASAA